jgi:hypothetical protein
MNRRGFIGSILALGAAPAIVRADSLMRIIPRETSLPYGTSVPITEASFPPILWPGVKEFWGKPYDDKATKLAFSMLETRQRIAFDAMRRNWPE